MLFVFSSYTVFSNGVFQVLFLILKSRIHIHCSCRLWHLISRRTIFQRFPLNCYCVIAILAGQIKRILFYDNFITFTVLFIKLGSNYTEIKKNLAVVRLLYFNHRSHKYQNNFWSIKKYKLERRPINYDN